KRQKDQSVSKAARTEWWIKRHIETGQQKHAMNHVGHQIRQRIARGADVAKTRRPFDPHKKDRRQGSHAQDQNDVAGKPKDVRFLETKVELECLPNTDPRRVRKGNHEWQQQVKGQTRQPKKTQPQAKSDVEKADAFDPDQRYQQRREKSDHGKIVGYPQAVND